jgi:hypothetical protein
VAMAVSEDSKRDRELRMQDRVRSMRVDSAKEIPLVGFGSYQLFRVFGPSVPLRNPWYGQMAWTTGWEIRQGTKKVARFVRRRDAMARLRELLQQEKGK